MYAVTVPFWYIAGRKVKRVLTARMVPVLSIFSAFSFAIMMFNLPLPGGTTGHAVGGTLLAVVLGPWAAVIGISVALVVQSLFFGDGGILAIGANCFNMAIILPLVGYFVYRLVSGNSPVASRRHIIGAVAGSYIGINIGAFLTALELGIQPLLFHGADGTPLYAPYGLNIAIPAMTVGHMLIAGPVEAIATGLVVSYLQRSHQHLLLAGRVQVADRPARSLKPLWAALGVMILLTPLGLLAPGTAWGEWGAQELQQMGLGFVPEGLETLSGLWPAPFPDYAIPGWGARVGYLVSAIAGIGLILGITWVLYRVLGTKKTRSSPQSPD